jgi:hypothetical protein
MAAIPGSKYGLLKLIVDLKVLRKDPNQENRIAARLNDHAAISKSHQQALFGNREYTPLSNHIFERLKKPIATYLSDEEEYERTFLWCEYFLALASLDARLSAGEAKELVENEKSDFLAFWIPVNRFGWRRVDLAEIAQQELPKAIQAGFFGKEPKQAATKSALLLELADRFTNRVRQEWRIFLH